MRANKALSSTRALAEALGVRKCTVHYYVKLGLLRPDMSFGSRFFAYDVARAQRAMRRITKLKDRGLSLREIADILSASAS